MQITTNTLSESSEKWYGFVYLETSNVAEIERVFGTVLLFVDWVTVWSSDLEFFRYKVQTSLHQYCTVDLKFRESSIL